MGLVFQNKVCSACSLRFFSLHHSSEMVFFACSVCFSDHLFGSRQESSVSFYRWIREVILSVQSHTVNTCQEPWSLTATTITRNSNGAVWQRQASGAQCVLAVGCGHVWAVLSPICCKLMRCGLPPSIYVFMVLYFVSPNTTTIYVCLKIFQAIK